MASNACVRGECWLRRVPLRLTLATYVAFWELCKSLGWRCMTTNVNSLTLNRIKWHYMTKAVAKEVTVYRQLTQFRHHNTTLVIATFAQVECFCMRRDCINKKTTFDNGRRVDNDFKITLVRCDSDFSK